MLEKTDIGTITQETNNGNVVLHRCTIAIKEQELKASNEETIKVIKSIPVVARIIYEKTYCRRRYSITRGAIFSVLPEMR